MLEFPQNGSCGPGLKGPTQQEKLEQWAAQGDFRAILDNVGQRPTSLIDLRAQVHYLNRAVMVASRGGTHSFLDELFETMVTFFGQVLVRLQLVSLKSLERVGNTNSERDLQLPKAFLEEYLPQFQQILRLLAELDQTRAATARMWQLAQKNGVSSTAAAPPSKLAGAGRATGNGHHSRLNGKDKNSQQ